MTDWISKRTCLSEKDISMEDSENELLMMHKQIQIISQIDKR